MQDEAFSEMTAVHWHEIPFVRICVPFIIGILTQQAIEGSTALIAGTMTAGILMIALIILRSPVRRLQLRSFLMLTILFSLGCFIRMSSDPDHAELSRLTDQESITVSVVDVSVKTEYGQKVQVSMIPPSSSQKNIRAITYIRGNIAELLPGDTMIFAGDLQLQVSNKNPYDFDVARYYRRQGIHLKASLDSADLLAVHPYKGPLHLTRKSAEVRSTIKEIFGDYVSDAQSCAVLLAMTVGIVDGLDDSIYDAYARTGTIHVLSISGLHVGIISFLLFLLVGKIRAGAPIWKQVMQLSVLLGGIWTFAYVAGLSPSVIRASLMTSIYLAGITMRRPVRALNVMAFTAFACLSVDPLQINSLSFQFSYLALCSILIFFKPLYRWLPVRTWPAKFTWGTIVMSISAQILLLPLLIHYFQQISLISIVSSLVAIPASYAILLGGVLLLLLHYLIPVVAELAGYLLEWIIRHTNEVIAVMSELPLSHLSNVYLHPFEIILISCMSLCIALRIVTHYRYWTYVTCASVLCFGVLHMMLLRNAHENELVAIYPYEETVAIDYILGRQCHSTLDISTLSKYTQKEAHMFRNTARVQSARLHIPDTTHLLKDVVVIELPTTDKSQQSSGYRIAVITGSQEYIPDSSLLALGADWVVLSSAMDYRRSRAAEQFLHSHCQPFHDLRKQGTFYLAKLKNNLTNEKLWQNITG